MFGCDTNLKFAKNVQIPTYNIQLFSSSDWSVKHNSLSKLVLLFLFSLPNTLFDRFTKDDRYK